MNTPRRAVHRAEAELAYFAVARALQLSSNLDVEDLRKLADLTHNVEDICVAVDLMRQQSALTDTTARDGTIKVVERALKARRQDPGAQQ